MPLRGGWLPPDRRADPLAPSFGKGGWGGFSEDAAAPLAGLLNAAARQLMPLRGGRLRLRRPDAGFRARPTGRKAVSARPPCTHRRPPRSPPSISGGCSAWLRGRKYGLSCPDLLSLASLPAQPLHPAGRRLAGVVRVVIKGWMEDWRCVLQGDGAQMGFKYCAAALLRVDLLDAAMEGYFCMGIQHNWTNAPNCARFHAKARTLCAQTKT